MLLSQRYRLVMGNAACLPQYKTGGLGSLTPRGITSLWTILYKTVVWDAQLIELSVCHSTKLVVWDATLPEISLRYGQYCLSASHSTNWWFGKLNSWSYHFVIDNAACMPQYETGGLVS